MSETNPVPETSCYLNTGKWKSPKTCNTKCYTPSSEPFKIYRTFIVLLVLASNYIFKDLSGIMGGYVMLA
jgi:hypothetical protein